MSAIFGDIWRPLLIALCVVVVVALCDQAFDEGNGLFAVMSGESYFRGRGVPLLGLLATAALSTTILYGASAVLDRRDF